MQQIMIAEKYGFDTAFVAEHHFVEDGWVPSPRIMCAAIAVLTKKIRIGTDIVLLPFYHPIHVAEDSAVLDLLSNGRFILGVGLGNRKEEFDAFGIPFKQRKSRFEEAIPLVRRLLAESSVNHSGRYFNFANIQITPKPVQKPSPPIWIAAEKSEEAVKRAARLGDAWVPSPMIPYGILKRFNKVYMDTLKEVGKNTDTQERPIRKEGYVSTDSETAWQESKDGFLYLYGKDYFRWGALWDDDGKPLVPSEADFSQYIEVLRRRFMLGSPDDFIAEAERYHKEVGADNILLRVQLPGLSHEKVMKSIKLLGEKVIPYLRERS